MYSDPQIGALLIFVFVTLTVPNIALDIGNYVVKEINSLNCLHHIDKHGAPMLGHGYTVIVLSSPLLPKLNPKNIFI